MRLRSLLVPACLTALVTGCTSYRPLPLRDVKTYQEAGDIHVAAVSSAPFEALATALRPTFQLDASKLLDEALTTTQATRSTLNKASQLLVGAAVPGADAPTPASAAPASPQAPSLPKPDLPESAERAPDLSTTGQHNQILRYQLATSLLQEVAMLNNYVRDAPRRQGYQAFVVRMQVTVRPLARATPYDAEVDMRFDCRDCVYGAPPIVVPLFVANNEDATAVSSLDRNLSQLGIALSALKGAYGLSGMFGRNVESAVSALGWQYQSVSNVGRLNEQTISVRLNAQPTGVKRFELIPRVHHVTVLVLVPGDAKTEHRELTVRAAKRFIHATTGDILNEAAVAHGKSINADVPDEDARIQVNFWPAFAAPPSQTAPLLISGTRAPYTAKLLLRGGANLTNAHVPSAQVDAGSQRRLVAAGVDVEEKSERQALVVTFNNLSDQALELLTRPSFSLLLKHRKTDEPIESSLTIRPEPVFPAEAKKSVQTEVVTDHQVTLSRDGSAMLSLSAAFPDKKAKVGMAKIRFENALPGEPLVFHGAARACAAIQANTVVLQGSCRFDVRLRNLPVSPDTDPPARLHLSVAEYSSEDASELASTRLPPVSLQFSRPRAATAAATYTPRH